MLSAMAHLALFGTIVKAFSARTSRDYAYLAALSFLMLLASTILAVNTICLALFTSRRLPVMKSNARQKSRLMPPQVLRWIYQEAGRLISPFAAAMIYQGFLGVMARRGYCKQHSETPQEFARNLLGSPLGERAADFTRHYNTVRFGSELLFLWWLRTGLNGFAESTEGEKHRRKQP